jgi:hypothetical protein
VFWSSGLPFLVVGAWETGLDLRLSPATCVSLEFIKFVSSVGIVIGSKVILHMYVNAAMPTPTPRAPFRSVTVTY